MTRPIVRVAVLALAGMAAGWACGLPAGLLATPTPTLTPSPTPTATPTRTPTPVPRTLLEAADVALFDADWETALLEYQSALASAVLPEQRAAALLGIGTTHLRAGRFAEALTTLDEYLAAYPSDTSVPQAHFLRALAFEEIDQD
ncbi:MAG TPA: tetratricopeptide repeat protein, partial [Anaerolineales bacterium]